ncbi:MAG TPA: peptidase M50 [Mycobacterium sp.]|nr:peptidase M50 [Mycobacterium sp.]
MKTTDTPGTAVLLCGDRRIPRPLTGLPVLPVDGPTALDSAIETSARLLVVGDDGDLAAVLTRLLRADRLDVEVGDARNCRTARRARIGIPRRVPLIRDETGRVIVGAATWRGDGGPLHGEAVVDDTVLFDGEVAGVRIEPTTALPGLRAGLITRRGRVRRWVAGRAAQLGTTGAVVVRDGVPVARPVRRSTFYRHTEGWLRVG